MGIEIHPKIAQWQAEGYELGMLDFAPSSELESGWYHPVPPHLTPIARFESDLLCVNATTGSLLVLDHEVSDRVHCEAAESQDTFLSAVQLLQSHFARCGADEAHGDDEAAGTAARQACAAAAGGEKYEPFFCGLIGW